MKNIIVGIDFSESSNNALELAKVMAKKSLAEITLLHTHMPTYVDPSIPIGLIDFNEGDLIKSLEKIARETQEQGIKTNILVQYGSLLQSVNDLSEEGKADFLVIGKSEPTGLIEKLLGSTSQTLLNNIKIPMLVVPQNFFQKEIKRICVASELEFQETNVWASILEISNFLNAGIDLLSIRTPDALDLNEDHGFLLDAQKTLRIGEEQIHIIEDENLQEGIKRYIKHHKMDLLVLNSHKRDFLEKLLAPSKSKSILSWSQFPVLIMRHS